MKTGERKGLRVLGISGSLRAQSTNSALLRAASLLSPVEMGVQLFDGLGGLPLFNPDVEIDNASPGVQDFRCQLQYSDAVIIASPEYAHGVTGAMKNALDWVVASGEFVGKPVALFNASPRANIALSSLADTLTMMDAVLIGEASISLPILGSGLNTEGIAANIELSTEIRSALNHLALAVGQMQNAHVVCDESQ